MTSKPPVDALLFSFSSSCSSGVSRSLQLLQRSSAFILVHYIPSTWSSNDLIFSPPPPFQLALSPSQWHVNTCMHTLYVSGYLHDHHFPPSETDLQPPAFYDPLLKWCAVSSGSLGLPNLRPKLHWPSQHWPIIGTQPIPSWSQTGVFCLYNSLMARLSFPLQLFWSHKRKKSMFTVHHGVIMVWMMER